MKTRKNPVRKEKPRAACAFPPKPHAESLECDYVSAVTAHITRFGRLNSLKASPFIVRGERIVA